MIIVPYTSIEVRKRQRTEIRSTDLLDLKEKITASGLLHAPVCWKDGEKWVLTVGERRYRAIGLMHDEGRPLHHNNELVPKGYIPITQLSEFLDEIGRHEAELNENISRVDLDWQDRTRALAALHEMRQKQNPKQTFAETAKEVTQTNVAPTKSAAWAAQRISSATVVAKHLDNEKIANARNENEAYALILKMEEEKATAALVRRQLATLPQDAAIQLRHGDSLDIISKLEPDVFDLILADPPYGLGAGGSGFRARTVHHHNYEDTPEEARKFAQTLLIEGFRVCKPRANIFIFCDIDLFDFLKAASANAGWQPFRRPLIWQKSESEGLAPWGSQGPRITTEFIFYATKGRRGLHASPIDVFNVKRVPRQERLHAAEKPVELLVKIISCATLPGDNVLDPCCGSGSTLVACKEAKRRGLGIEKDLDYYNTAMANVFGAKP